MLLNTLFRNMEEIVNPSVAHITENGAYDMTPYTEAKVNVYIPDDDISVLTALTYSDVKELRDNGELAPGCKYRITDYDCTTTQDNTQSAGHVFDIIVEATSEDTLNENVRFIKNDDDDYFANSNLNAWEGKYSIDLGVRPWSISQYGKIFDWDYEVWSTRNPSLDGTGADKQYAWSAPGYIYYTASETPEVGDDFDLRVEEEGDELQEDYSTVGKVKPAATQQELESYKGTIYFLRDEFENEAFYDFKNIQFKRFAVSDVNFTGYTSDTMDAIRSTFIYDNNDGKCYGFMNEYEEYFPYNISYNNGFNNEEYTAIEWEFDESIEAYYYTFGFGSDTDFSLGGNCYGNKISYFSEGLNNIVFGDYAQVNTFGDYCYNNTFGNGVGNNTFGNNVNYNNFGNSIGNNTFGNDIYQNTFGNNVYRNTFGNGVNNNKLIDYIYYCSFGNGIFYCDLTSYSTGSNNAFQYITVLDGTQGSDTSNLLTLSGLDTGVICSQVCGLLPDGSGGTTYTHKYTLA